MKDKSVERVHKASMGYLTKASIKRMYDRVLGTKDTPTHYIDKDGVHKINAKPRTKSRRLLNT